MKRKETLVDLLDALFQRSAALLMMQVDIESGEFTYAMSGQFEYLYWMDETIRLFNKFRAEHLVLINALEGIYIEVEEV